MPILVDYLKLCLLFHLEMYDPTRKAFLSSTYVRDPIRNALMACKTPAQLNMTFTLILLPSAPRMGDETHIAQYAIP